MRNSTGFQLVKRWWKRKDMGKLRSKIYEEEVKRFNLVNMEQVICFYCETEEMEGTGDW